MKNEINSPEQDAPFAEASPFANASALASSRCDATMNSYLQLDKNEHVPLALTLHLLTCKKCRRMVKLLSLAEKAYAAPLQIEVPLTDSTLESVMQKVAPEISADKLKNPISMLNWIVGGIVMIVFMFTLIPILTATPQTKNLLLAFCIVFACCVTAYCAMFIASNIDFFVKRIATFEK